MNSPRPMDFLVASLPTVSATIIAQANQVIGMIGSLLGIAYLLWRWKREWSGKKHD